MSSEATSFGENFPPPVSRPLRFGPGLTASVVVHGVLFSSLALLAISQPSEKKEVVTWVTIEAASLEAGIPAAPQASAAQPAVESPPPVPPVEQKKPEKIASLPKPVSPVPVKKSSPRVEAARPETSRHNTDAGESSTPADTSVAPTGERGSGAGNAATLTAANSRGYFDTLSRWLMKHQRYPLMARRRKLEGTVVARVHMTQEGRVQNASIERSSGFEILDEAALQMIDDSNPFPPPPVVTGSRVLHLLVPISFKLKSTG